MIRRLNHTLTLSLLLVVALGLSIWATQASLEANAQNNANADSRDAFMTEVSYLSFNKAGAWESEFHSAHIDHFGDKHIAILEKPLINTQGEAHLTWRITANQGMSYDDGKTVVLKDQVLIEKNNHKTQVKTAMHTREITLYPKKKYLETQEPVKIEQAGSVIEAIGFKADLNTGDMELSSESKGVYNNP